MNFVQQRGALAAKAVAHCDNIALLTLLRTHLVSPPSLLAASPFDETFESARGILLQS